MRYNLPNNNFKIQILSKEKYGTLDHGKNYAVFGENWK